MTESVQVAIALVWDRERLLITRRPLGAHLGGYWEFPGGKLAPGETPEACAVREVREEVGLTVGARSRRARIEHSYSERSVVLYPVDCDFVGGELRLLEVSDARWVLRHELLTLTFPEANRGLIAELVAEVAPPRDGRAE
ncbi:MAG TPA: (deoxy)nucleoside triphosphate pyrophosphohydrolase [Polyangiaceae bacterium]|nr:(deoxy)nucleoside triphosphate pyrophosphohydrolase [Polyangiaceae bacterium]